MVDVRTPAEFAKGHIPGAINIPIFSDEERVIIGTLYKQEGKDTAVQKGLDLVGSKLSDFVLQAKKTSSSKELLLHCWRGGMRSGSMAWLFETAGMRVHILKGGYKSFRNYVLKSFEANYDLAILGGMTGSGKTNVLEELRAMGEQVIDLEKIAQHQGSSFGSLGTLIQPTQEQFENLLALEFYNCDPAKTIWLEDESITIGKRVIPARLWHDMRESMLVRINVPEDVRINNLVAGYSKLSSEFLEESIIRISKRLGGEATAQALEHLHHKEYTEVVKIVLRYYDKTYRMGLSQRVQERIVDIDLDTGDIKIMAKEILKRWQSLKN